MCTGVYVYTYTHVYHRFIELLYLYMFRALSAVHHQEVEYMYVANCTGYTVRRYSKVKDNLITDHQGPRGINRGIALLILNLGARWGGWSAARPGRFASGKDTVPIVGEAGWAPGPVRTGAENLASTGIRSPERPARSQSLYRLSYPGPQCKKRID
jgi:hypothetical protein